MTTPRSMDTAPRDGTKILVLVGNLEDRRRIARWEIVYWHPFANRGQWYSSGRRRITGVVAWLPLPPLWDGTERRGMIARFRRKMINERRSRHSDDTGPDVDRRIGERRNRHGGRRLGIDYTEEDEGGPERRAFVPEVRVLPPERRTVHPEGRRVRHVISGDPAFVDRRTKWPDGRRVGEDFNDRRKK